MVISRLLPPAVSKIIDFRLFNVEYDKHQPNPSPLLELCGNVVFRPIPLRLLTSFMTCLRTFSREMLVKKNSSKTTVQKSSVAKSSPMGISAATSEWRNVSWKALQGEVTRVKRIAFITTITVLRIEIFLKSHPFL